MEKAKNIHLMTNASPLLKLWMLMMSKGSTMDIYECEICELSKGKPKCGSVFQGATKLMQCTRPMGHDGDCMACGVTADEHPMAVWKKEQAVTPESSLAKLMALNASPDRTEKQLRDEMVASLVLMVKLADHNPKAFKEFLVAGRDALCRKRMKIFLLDGRIWETRIDHAMKLMCVIKTGEESVVIRELEYAGDEAV